MAGEIMRGRLWTERRIDNVRETEFLFVEKDEFCLFPSMLKGCQIKLR